MKEEEFKTKYNLRDALLSGCSADVKVKSGMIYRSANFDDLENHNLYHLENLKLKKIIDLRRPSEIKIKNNLLPNAERINITFSKYNIIQGKINSILFKKNSENKIIENISLAYSEIIDQIHDTVKLIFDILADERNYPLLIHCFAGKDRTGIIIALIQLSLGFNKNCIVEDYLETNKYISHKSVAILRVMKFLSVFGFPYKNFYASFFANSEFILSAIEKIDNKYGGIEDYLEVCGIPSDQLNRIREILIVK